jgi:iron complex outermembrane recepter protein
VQDHTVEGSGERHRIPGVPGLMAGLLLHYQGPAATVLELGGRHMAAVPVGRSANRELPAYQLLHLRAEWWRPLRARHSLVLFVHVENLADVRYSSFVQALDPLGRYHNPSPGRSFFAGIRLQRR